MRKDDTAMTEAKPIGVCLPEVDLETEHSQPSNVICFNRSQAVDRANLDECKAIVAAGIPPLPATSAEHFTKCLMYLVAALPKRNSSETEGKLLVDAYRRKLGHLPEKAISYLTDQALGRCEWFPTIAECLKIVGEWRRDDEHTRAFAKAEHQLFWDRQNRFVAAMRALCDRTMTVAEMGSLPKSWIAAAVDQGYLIQTSCGVQYRRLPEPMIQAATPFDDNEVPA